MIDWENICNGFRGFEKLALKYVETEFQFPCGPWKQTGETRDGNKDAYTVIVGFHPYVGKDETWWMEAKYSSSNKYLTRYRLDATIVSSIFHGKISKVIFVTNIDIHSKTISDVRIALQKSINCEKVHFCTKNVIEYWLVNNPEIYQLFWKTPMKSIVGNTQLFVSEDISVYPNSGGYVEECKLIYSEKDYLAYLKIVSPTDQEISISPMQKGIVLETKSLKLERGENTVNVIFHLTNSFQNIHAADDVREYYLSELFKMANKEVALLKNPIEILLNSELKLNISSQEGALTELLTLVKKFRRERKLQFVTLYGESGTGKSYVTHKFMCSKSMRNEMIFYNNFTENHAENAKRVVDLVLFLLFPYMNPEDVDSSYLDEIKEKTKITSYFMQLVSMRNHPDNLEKAFQRYCDEIGNILPQQCELNARYIVLDNFQNLSHNVLAFLQSMFLELRKKDCPIFFLFVGQPYILDRDFYRELKSKYEIKKFECKIEDEDIISNLYKIMSFKFDISNSILAEYFPNLIILIEFLKYIRNFTSSEFHNLDDFLTLYMPFVNGGMEESLILDQFSTVMSDSKLAELCYTIYTTIDGICIEKSNHDAVYALIHTGLVKLNAQNRLVPFHDIYEDIFRKTRKISKKELGLPYTDELDEAREMFLYPELSGNDLLREAELISRLRREERFRSVCYILGGHFQNTYSPLKSILLKSARGAEIYHQLYFDYAYAATNCDYRYTGYDYFEIIYKEINDKTSTKMRLMQLNLLFELMNSNYNIFEYTEAMRHYGEFRKTLVLLKRSGSMPTSETESEIMPILCENMRILIQSSRGKRRSEQMFLRWVEVLKKDTSLQHHCIDFYVRYAHTLYTVDIKRAFRYTQEAHTLLPDDTDEKSKIWCLVEFQYLYLQLLINRNYSLLARIEVVVDVARENFYSSYRHRNLALCSILYRIGDVQKADDRFFRDRAKPRRLRNKLQGFYYETLALHYLAHENIAEASVALNKAAEIFQSVPSYLRVIRHNQKVLKRDLFSSKRYDLYLGKPLKRDWYYIDPRAD
jgi:hypothetical protein